MVVGEEKIGSFVLKVEQMVTTLTNGNLSELRVKAGPAVALKLTQRTCYV